MRAGIGAIEELQMLMQTAEIFWPNFLGRIIVVLDEADRGLLQNIPAFRKSNHSIRVRETIPREGLIP